MNAGQGHGAEVDPVTREVVGNGLVSAAEEMSRALRRSAYSAIIYDMLDYSCAIFGRNGELVSQAENLPAQLGVMSSAIVYLLRKSPPDTMRKGDVFITNHPYKGATHTNDLIIVTPIFFGDRLMAFAGTNAHHMDVGGKTAATEAADAVEIWQEGLIFPNVRLYDAGVPNQALFDVIEAMVRIPKETIGDIRAQIAACRTGERRWLELCKKYGADELEAFIEDLWDYTERIVRAEIAAMRPGTYRAEGFMDPDFYGTEPVKIVVTLTIGDGSIHADFTGSDAQVRGSLNCPIASTVSSVWYAIRCMIEGDVQQNEGCYRPISTTVPEGCLLNPVPPAAVSVRHLTEQKVADIMLQALRAAKPARSAAGCSVSFPTYNVTGIDPRTGESYLCPDIIGGGMGGYEGGDGMSAIDTHMGNCAMMSAEAMEVEFPVRVLKTVLVPDSGGAGRYRGGLAVERWYEILAPEANLSGHYADQTLDETRPWAVDGGLRGTRAAILVNPGTPGERELKGKGVDHPMKQGEILVLRGSGGGGWGPPGERSPEALRDDLANGYVTHDGARRDYGLDPTSSGGKEEAS